MDPNQVFIRDNHVIKRFKERYYKYFNIYPSRPGRYLNYLFRNAKEIIHPNAETLERIHQEPAQYFVFDNWCLVITNNNYYKNNLSSHPRRNCKKKFFPYLLKTIYPVNFEFEWK